MVTGIAAHLFFPSVSSVHWYVIDLDILIGGLQLEDDGEQAVIAGADGNTGGADPVPKVEGLLARPVGQGKYILIDRLPGLITQPVRFGVVGIEYLSLPKHGTGRQSFHSVFPGQVLLKCLAQNGDLYFFHRPVSRPF